MEITRVDTTAAQEVEIVDYGANSATDQMDFLKLLTTQLANQDPLNPVDNQQFISQQATFAQLEQLVNLNTKLTDFVSSQEDVLTGITSVFNSMQSAGFLGKGVSFFTDEIVVGDDGSVSPMYYDLTRDAYVGYSVYNEAGVRVASGASELELAGDRKAIPFDGTDTKGNALPAGRYRVSLDVRDTTGAPMTGKAYTEARVTGIDYRSGTPEFTLNDGRELAMADIFALLEL